VTTRGTKAEALQACLDNPPSDWRDPEGDGRKAPERDRLSWAISCGAGAHQWRSDLERAWMGLREARRRVEIAKARLEGAAEASYSASADGLEQTVERLTALLRAAGATVEDGPSGLRISGGWVDAGMAALSRRVGDLEHSLGEATGALADLKSMRRMLNGRPVVREEMDRQLSAAEAARAKVETALGEATAARADLLAQVDADRKRLAELRSRRVA